MTAPYRQNLDRTWTRGEPTITVFSGLRPDTRTLYIGAQGAAGRVDLLLTCTRFGFDTHRRFSLAPGQTVSCNADGMSGARLDVIASSVTGAGFVVASESPRARDTADDFTAWWIDEYAGGIAHRVPDGARRVAIFTAPTSLEWVLYDGAGASRAIAGPAVVGSVGEVLGTHFQSGATFYAAFEIGL